jgi:hypothetical protein
MDGRVRVFAAFRATRNRKVRTRNGRDVWVNLQALSYKKLGSMTPLQIHCSFQVSQER